MKRGSLVLNEKKPTMRSENSCEHHDCAEDCGNVEHDVELQALGTSEVRPRISRNISRCPRRAYGEVLGQALYQTEDEGIEDIHVLFVFLASGQVTLGVDYYGGSHGEEAQGMLCTGPQLCGAC